MNKALSQAYKNITNKLQIHEEKYGIEITKLDSKNYQDNIVH